MLKEYRRQLPLNNMETKSSFGQYLVARQTFGLYVSLSLWLGAGRRNKFFFQIYMTEFSSFQKDALVKRLCLIYNTEAHK